MLCLFITMVKKGHLYSFGLCEENWFDSTKILNILVEVKNNRSFRQNMQK